MNEPALVVQNLSKTFRIPKQHVHTLKERALHPFRSMDYREYPVLRDISFEVQRGEFFGIVGRNGSGKSTLLKCMAGIYRPEQGAIKIAGRLAPFIELGVGFNPDLTALDNVVINGVMMGLSPREARRRFDEIIAFAELEEFLDLKLKNYSSGMQVRLAFAVMVQASADVLLIDEVLAVGDAAFAQKCLDVFYRLRDEGRTIILVTHDMGAVEQFCHRAMFLQDGDIKLIGDPAEVGRAYLAANFSRDPEEGTGAGGDAGGQVAAEARFVDDGVTVNALASGRPVCAVVELHVRQRIEHPTLLVQLRDAEHAVLTGARIDLHDDGPLLADQRLRIEVGWDVTLSNGHYDLGVLLTQGTAEVEIVADERALAGLTVHSAERDVVGLIQPPTQVAVTQHPQEMTA